MIPREERPGGANAGACGNDDNGGQNSGEGSGQPTATQSPTTIVPYVFQRDGAAALIASGGNPLASCATGTGKSVVIAEVCRCLDGRILVLVPTRELCEQNEAALRQVWPAADAGVLCAGLERHDHDARNLVATIHSCHALLRGGQLGLIGIRTVVIVDEAHRVPAADSGMYREVVSALAPSKVMGLTATPYRLDSGRLDEGADRLFDCTAFEFGLREGIDWRGPAGERLLVPLIAKRTAGEIDTRGVKIRGGDFVESELQERANTDALVDAAVEEIMRYSAGRHRWLAFCCGTEHANHVAAVLTSHGVDAAAITYETSADDRRDLVAAYRHGDLTCLCGCNIFTTGFNVPEVDLIAFLRPTKSTSLYVQMAGRGTRWAKGKDNCLVLDFARNVERLGPVDDPWIPDGGKSDDSRNAGHMPLGLKECPECHSYVASSSSYCPDCGHVFSMAAAPGHRDVASDLPVMSGVVTWLDVVGAGGRRHVKPGSPPCLHIRYHTKSGETVSQFLPFEHPRARRHAERRWIDLHGNMPAPATVAEALQRMEELQRPVQIAVRHDGPYLHVARVRHDAR